MNKWKEEERKRIKLVKDKVRLWKRKDLKDIYKKKLNKFSSEKHLFDKPERGNTKCQ